jgi:hypothetical protein
MTTMPRGYSGYSKLLLAFGLTAAGAESCGGRTLSDDIWSEAGGETGSGRGGSGDTGSGRAGARSGGAAGTRGKADGAGGIGGAGGTGNAGAAGQTGCGKAICPDIGCGPGFMSVVPPGDCCPTCEPVPCNGACATIACPSGTHLEKPSGQCCPSCVQDPADACKDGQAAYLTFRLQLIDKYTSVGCKASNDCAIVYENNRCVSNCGTALPVNLADSAQQNLRAAAESDCASCPPAEVPPCIPEVASCIQGKCSLGGPPPP